jgi:hypothetical protein
VDIPEVAEIAPELLRALATAAGHKRVLALSAASRQNIPSLMTRLLKLLASAPPPSPAVFEPRVQLDAESDGQAACEVARAGDGAWWLSGARIEKAAAMTNWDYHEAQVRGHSLCS